MADRNQVHHKVGGREAKVFLLSSIVLSTAVFNIAFWYGVTGAVFFEHLFYIWVAASVALAASMLIPHLSALPPFVSWHGRFVLVLPTIWLALEAAIGPAALLSEAQQWMLWSLAISILVLTLPYITYVLVLITIPDIEYLRSAELRAALFGFALASAVAGLAIGLNHPRFLTCRDFEIAGDHVPPNCLRSSTYLADQADQ